MEKIFVFATNDLEGLTIKKVLEKTDHNFLESKVKWGVSYDTLEPEIKSKIALADQLNQDIYFIEIIGVPERDNHHIIDHHGELAYTMPSSLEQVANLIEYKLTDYEMRVAINDRDHIDGLYEHEMLERCSNLPTIKDAVRSAISNVLEIRNNDYYAQGIPIKKLNTKVNKEIKFIKSNNIVNMVSINHVNGSNSIAPINDILILKFIETSDEYYICNRYLIVISSKDEEGNKEINLDGPLAYLNKLRDNFESLKELGAGDYFWQGGRYRFNRGYFGFTHTAASDDDINTLINKVIDIALEE